jgi:hypothetical protein
MDLHGNDDLIDLSANISSLEIGIKKTNELNEIFTALENSSPLIAEKEIKEDETVEREYEEIFVKKNKLANTGVPLPPLPVDDLLPIPVKKPKKEKPVTVEMLDEMFVKKMLKPSDDDYEWMNNKVKFKKDDDMSKMCKYIDEHVLMESSVYFNINTDYYIMDLDKLITKFERMKVSETIASPTKDGLFHLPLIYRIIYKDPYGYTNRRIEPWIELTVTGNKFTKSVIDGIHDIYVAQCKKYLTEHDKYKKNDSCGFKRIFELKTGRTVEIFCLVKRQ